MFVKQLSIFLENRAGRLDDALATLKDNGINIISLSLADTSDFGILRLIVSAPERARQVLKDAKFSAQLGDIIAICIPHTVGSLSDALGAVRAANINIEYMYTLSVEGGDASLALKTADQEKTIKIFKEKGVRIYTQEDFS